MTGCGEWAATQPCAFAEGDRQTRQVNRAADETALRRRSFFILCLQFRKGRLTSKIQTGRTTGSGYTCVIDPDENSSQPIQAASAIVLTVNSTFWWSAGGDMGGYCRKTMLRFPRFRAAVFLVCLIVVAGPIWAKRAPDPTFKTIDGQSHKLSALRGQVVV